ncbi:hypothetical protein HPP92_021988 [Vanilla planifolia]|uniref:Pectinesterase inhibitor domain-containing protein n=1 Tax=Vanilla planifolia TaxID=51239 RepID=A0A835UF79_VANPL|nr:hypothetical protein HPP92_021988 [Vanilla planifolia]
MALSPNADPSGASKNDSTEFISSRCSRTTYPVLCRTSLSAYASQMQSSPAKLAQVAVVLSHAHAESAFSLVTSMAKSGTPNRDEAAVLADCGMMMGDAVKQLQRSRYAMGAVLARGLNAKASMENAQTWVSSGLTDESMCASGLARVDLGGKRDVVRGRVVMAARLTSNALSLIGRLASSMEISP